jgi:adenylate cyclase, class 2
MDEPRRNLELKARDRDPVRSLSVCLELGAEDRGTLVQRDTYFEVPRGRLKLREEADAGAQLIAYERPDLPGSRESRYRLVEVPDPDAMREALAATLGVTVVVAKSRRLFLHEGVRIHLDRVEGLGTFIEFEGVVPEGGDPTDFAGRLDRLSTALRIDPGDVLSESYADLVRAAGA